MYIQGSKPSVTSLFCYRLSPLHRRQLEGALSRVPDGFYPKVWLVLSKTLEGINLQGHKIDKKATTTNMTLSELNFRLTVEDMLSKCVNSEYRQIIVEVIHSFDLERNKIKKRSDRER
jgi:phosphorylase kinase alpha/beta subunit